MDDRSNGRDREEVRGGPFFGNRSNEPAVSLKSVNWLLLLSYLKPNRSRMTLAVLAL
jgi:hypothetical protein